MSNNDFAPIVKETRISSVEINTLDEMENLLKDLQRNSSDSLAAAYNAQLQVIALINSPKLVDSTFDLFFANIKKAIKYAEGQVQRELMRDKCHLLIHNYIFFQNAKLEYLVQDNKKTGEKLLTEAAEMFAETSFDIVTMGKGGNIKIVAKNLSKSIIKKTQDSGFFSRIIKWYFKKEKQKEEEENFTLILEVLLQKIDRYKKLMGKSDITAGLVRRWSDKLIQHSTFASYKDFQEHNPSRYLDSLFSFLIGLFVIAILLSGATALYDFLNGNTLFRDGGLTYGLWKTGGIVAAIVVGMCICLFVSSLVVNRRKYLAYKKEVANSKKIL